MKDILLWVYVIGWVITYWHDSSYLYNIGYSYWWAILAGIIDGLIWPVRWGHDIVIHILNKKAKQKGK